MVSANVPMHVLPVLSTVSLGI